MIRRRQVLKNIHEDKHTLPHIYSRGDVHQILLRSFVLCLILE